MAKKNNAKTAREAAEAARKNKYQQAAAIREKTAEEARIKAEVEKKATEESKIKEKELKRFKLDLETRSMLPKNKRKSLVKAAGLKSTIAVGDELYMTSFGKGNEAIVEKKISNKTVTQINTEKETFLVDNSSISETIIPIQSKRIAGLSSNADNPLYRKETENGVQPDKLLLKDTLERIYFGKTFNDTLHIQIIYNILDIEKILTIHSVNTVYTINNLFGSQSTEDDDFISKLTFQNSFEEFCSKDKKRDLFNNFCEKQTLGYYGDVFYKNKKLRPKEEVYNILALIATVRQWCIHCEEDKRTWIYNVEKVLDRKYLDILDDVYECIIKKINSRFIYDNKVNLAILSDVLNMTSQKDFEELIRMYYRFIVTKEQKLLGFSVKKVRNKMLEGTMYTSTEYDSIRSKFYKIIDFILFYNYSTNPDEKEYTLTIVEKLRSSLSDEIKDQIYSEEGTRTWNLYEEIITQKIIKWLDPTELSELIDSLKDNEDYKDKTISGIVKQETSDISYFSKIIYLISQFINRKEVNDLTTGLINKFDNIRSFIDTCRYIGLESTFTDDYKFFDTAEKLTRELHVIKNLTCMGYSDLKRDYQMYLDAIDILGIEENYSDDKIKNLFCLDANGKPINTQNDEIKGLRNFIISNVIKSDRFIYLVKYCNPKKIRKIANNENIVKFVLGEIPEPQIKKHYEKCNPQINYKGYPGREIAIDNLTKIIINMRFNEFENVKQKIDDDDIKALQDKSKSQAIIRLYLTVCYLVVKNLVNINSRYAMAIHALERDARLYGVYDTEKKYKNKLSKNMAILTETLLSDNHETAGNLHLKSKKWNRLMRTNLNNYSPEASMLFRNAIAHLNPIRNADEFVSDIRNIKSYFDIYHYIVQKSILMQMEQNKKTDKILQYEECINKYHSYCMDFLKALCVPFGYNIVRFKALSIYEMFDRNYSSDKSTEEERKVTKSNS